jgi:hypothetical protein
LYSIRLPAARAEPSPARPSLRSPAPRGEGRPRGPSTDYISHNPRTAAISAGGRWLPWVWLFKSGGQLHAPPHTPSLLRKGHGTPSRRASGHLDSVCRLFHSSTPESPVHVWVSAGKPARPLLAKGGRTQLSESPQIAESPTSPAWAPALPQCPSHSKPR